tara:strand:- start:250 stop:453 length:204 start_codon:yes stop_codon:yes gene_type:complete
MKVEEIDTYRIKELDIEIHEILLIMDVSRELLKRAKPVYQKIEALLEQEKKNREEEIRSLLIEVDDE